MISAIEIEIPGTGVNAYMYPMIVLVVRRLSLIGQTKGSGNNRRSK